MSTSRPSSSKLGQLLVERGDVSGEQLIRAIQSQRSLGGRIGTCLLEMDVVTEDALLAALSEQLGVPAIRIEQLRGIGDEVLALIPPRTALRCQAVPFSATVKEVSVAVLDVRNLTLIDELAFSTGRQVRPHIANEVRIFEALEKYYGFECPRRYEHLLDRLNRSRYLWDQGAEDLLEAPGSLERRQLIRSAAGRSARAAHAASERPEGADRRRSSSSGVWELEHVVEPAALPPPSLADLDRLLADPPSRDQVGRLLVRLLGQSFTRSAIFKVRKERVCGWLAQGGGIDQRLFQALELDLGQPSIFFNLHHGGDFYLGPLPPMPVHTEMARAWGGILPKECLMVPIRIRGRLVSVLYGDRGAAGLGGLEVEGFLTLARKASKALEVWLLRKKEQVA